MKKIIFFAVALFALSVSSAGAQTTHNNLSEKNQKTIYYYTFTGTGNLEELRLAALKLTDVTEAKSEYKAEKSAGQLRVVVAEKKRRSEGEEEFSPADLKKLIAKYNFQPVELKSEPFSEN